MFTVLLLTALFLVFLRMFVFKSRKERLLDKIPGPKSYPIIGNLLDFDYPKTEITETTKQFSFKYGPVYLIRFGTDAAVLIRNPSDVEIVLGSTSILEKAPVYWVLQPWLNQGLLTSSGDTWKKHRKILTPAFHFQILEKFVPVFVKNSHIFVNKLTKMVGQEIDIMPIFSLCALDIIFETAMGLEINAQLGKSKYVEAVDELLEIVSHRSFSLIQRSPLFSLLPIGRKHNQLVAYLHSVTENVMKKRKAILQTSLSEKVNNIEDGEDIGLKKKKAFLDLLLEYNTEEAGMTDSEIRDEVDTFMFEGYDTTSSAFSFCLYCLSQNQHIQDKVYEEQKRVFDDSLKDCDYQHLQEMKYLEKVIKESLRMYPTIQFVARKSNKDIDLKSGYTVPANTSIIVLIEPMNLDPELYPEPLTFNPDRFDRKTPHPFSYIPFGAGPRNCIGQKYAMAELKSVISLFIRKFRLLPSKIPITPSFNVVLKSSTGVHLFIEHRNKSCDESGVCG